MVRRVATYNQDHIPIKLLEASHVLVHQYQADGQEAIHLSRGRKGKLTSNIEDTTSLWKRIKREEAGALA